MFTLGPFTVSSQAITLNPQSGNKTSQPLIGAVVFNASSQTFGTQFAGNSDWLHAYSVMSFPASGNNFPQIVLTPDNAGGEGLVYATVFQMGDKMPSNIPTTISTSTVNIGGTASVDASGSTIELAAGTAVDVNGTVSVDASGSTIDLASGSIVDVTGSTVDLASGATVSIGNTPIVELASGASVDITGTPTVDIAPGANVVVTDIQNVTGNVSVVNPSSGNALITRTFPVGSDVLASSGGVNISNYESPTGSFSNFTISADAGQLVVLMVVVAPYLNDGPSTVTFSLDGQFQMIGPPASVTTVAGAINATLLYGISNGGSGAQVQWTKSGNSGFSLEGIGWAVFGETTTTGYSNGSLAGTMMGLVTFNQATPPFTVSASGGPTDSLAIVPLLLSSGGNQITSSDGDVVEGFQDSDGNSALFWYSFFNRGEINTTFTGNDISTKYVLTEPGLWVPQ